MDRRRLMGTVLVFSVGLTGCQKITSLKNSSSSVLSPLQFEQSILKQGSLFSSTSYGFNYAVQNVQLATANDCPANPRENFSITAVGATAAHLKIDDTTSIIVDKRLDKSDLNNLILGRTLTFDANLLKSSTGTLRFQLTGLQSVGDVLPSFINTGESNFKVKYFTDVDGSIRLENAPTLRIKSANAGQLNCPQPRDPLVIYFPKSKNDIQANLTMTAPSQGIEFDIHGSSAGYQKQKIAWLAQCTECYFLVKPNSSAAVLGIDELFGDSTKGPDGALAEDGFAALKKYDTNSDSVIDAQDTIFSNLKLWNDANRNGIADSGELLALSEKKIISISLNYNPHFREVDQYGNEIRYKSAVLTQGEELGIVFDLWFQPDINLGALSQ